MLKHTLILIPLFGMLFAEGNPLKFSGQVRQRFEMVDKDFTNTTSFNNKNYLRTRFAVSYDNDDYSTFVQLQDSRIFGTETNTLKDGTADALDVHQAYFKLKNLFGVPLTAKVGRFEAAYGPQRLMGAVGWHNIGRSFDGVIFNLTNDFANVDFFNFKQVEASTVNDNDDFNVRGAYAHLSLMDGHKTQAFAIQDGDRMTFGGYGKGVFAGVSYELEFAMQNGTESDDVNYGGMMYGLNAGYKIAGMTLSAGVDFVSGDDTTTTDVNESFNTLYATNHKYYGYMDYFLNLPVHTGGLGLSDIHVKMSGLKVAGHVVNVAYHMFNADQSEDSFGNELDITLVKKYADNVKIVAGYSIFMPGKLKEENGANASFAYLMTIVNF
ncbi:MAG: alginate export family protein [Candidatus Marinimicrobia bacterium]|nr:alginate export family protein [Candidatus Neomarinimicrobiota bacterium]MBT4593377.1 alginate export family protein [Candidatus Neomarinimicrobiota bacterium]